MAAGLGLLHWWQPACWNCQLPRFHHHHKLPLLLLLLLPLLLWLGCLLLLHCLRRARWVILARFHLW